MAVATDRLIDFKTFQVGKDGGIVRLKTSAAWGGGAYVLVTVDPAARPGVDARRRAARSAWSTCRSTRAGAS